MYESGKIGFKFMANIMNDMIINIVSWIGFWGSSCCEIKNEIDIFNF